MKKIIVFLLASVMIVSMTSLSFAGTVTYYQDANEFVVSTEDNSSPTDLFKNFKDIMPGTSYQDMVILKNDASNKNSVKVYLRSYGSSTATTAFLSHLFLTVKAKDESKLFDAPASEKAQLSDWVYIGTVHPGGEIPLNLELLVDPELDNEFQENIGYLKWAFMVEGVDPTPDPKPDPKPVKPDPSKTGDNSLLWQYSLISILSVMLLCIVVKGIKKNRKKKNNN